MPAFIPVLLLPIDAEVAAACASPEAAEGILGAASRNAELRVASSTNSWFSVLTCRLCRGWRIEGLEWLSESLHLLTPVEAARAARSASVLMEHLGDAPLPALVDLGPELEALASADRAAAARHAVAAYEIDEISGDVPSYFSFVATLRAALEDAAGSGRYLLFYGPRP